ncbi:tumor necrosis factor receptor superfamily member 6B-like [Anoplopoma fimbria]|uniref:tumor necrosis factor receptor superfamily member 6B-like n=1 Tax=Anoplopoma fimbria TaxID=229290 RepID=UPI0023EB5C75|nr:tumor necrosis factor receptor superfamily member 6B-like [Anoplopoma fimbria]
MNIISMILLPVLLLLSGVESTPKFSHRDSSTGEALTCDRCRPGTHMKEYCTATTTTVCAPCKSNHYTELWNYLPKCLYCHNLCTENQAVETECTATNDRVCRCIDGFYMTGDFCMRHAECRPGHCVKTNGTSQTNTVCERCPDDHVSPSPAQESCVKQQQCTNDQIVLLRGSINHNTLCGSCEDLANNSETLRAFFSGFFSMHRMPTTKMSKFVARYILKQEDGTLSKQRDHLMDQIRKWLAQAPEEQLKELPKMLKASELGSMTKKLERTLNEIKQQSPNCTLLIDV